MSPAPPSATGTCCCGFSSGRFVSTDVATEIFRWSTRIPRCAISALSTLRTVCFGVTSVVVNRWISSTAPVSLATIRAAMIPGGVASNSSAHLMGRTLPAMGDACGWDNGVFAWAVNGGTPEQGAEENGAMFGAESNTERVGVDRPAAGVAEYCSPSRINQAYSQSPADPASVTILYSFNF